MTGDQRKRPLVRERILACKNLGAKPDLLDTICRYGESLDDHDVLSELRHWNSFGPVQPDRVCDEIGCSADCTPRGDD